MCSQKWFVIFSSLLLVIGSASVALVAMSGSRGTVLVSVCGVILLCLALLLLLVRRVFINDRIREQKAIGLLREREQMYRELVENTNSIILRMDLSGRITFLNEYAQQLFGYGLEEISGRTVVGTVFPERETGGRDNLALLESLCRTPDSYPLIEIECYTKDGRKVWISWANRGYCDPDDRLVGVLSVGQDITERKRLHEVMIFTEKMMTMGGLAAGMAHELNNPIGGILQNAQNLARRLSPELPTNRTAASEAGIDLESLQEYLKKRGIHDILSYIVTSCERSADIVARMLAFSRRGGGKTEPVGLPELVERTIELASCDYDLKKSYNFRSIPIVREYLDGLPPVSVNPMEIEQVLLNLLKNAAQAISELPDSPESHRIVIRTHYVTPFAAIDIEDDGPGIPTELHARIFEPFFTTKDVGIGTGLGLSVSYSIVANNHGSISLDPSYTDGARFTIKFPLDSPSADFS